MKKQKQSKSIFLIVKRAFDLLLAVCVIIAMSPVLFLIAVIIKLTSSGPILFKQKRIKQYKKDFYIFKFRTMYIDAPKDVPTHLLNNPDKFITPFGKFLRKTSLDELPQLFNILKGDMSFVGPRPALYNQYDLISLRERYGVNNIPVGLTGWAQINGRDELSIEDKVSYDYYYLQHMSFKLDCLIIFNTFFRVLSSKGVVEGGVKRGKKNVENKDISI